MSTRPLTVVNQLTPEQIAIMKGLKAWICNITEQDWLAFRSYSNFEIKGRVQGEPYALTEMTGRIGTIDLGDKKKLDFPITAREIADDLCRELNGDAGDGSFMGLFVCAGQVPTEEELAEARRLLDAFYVKQVAMADGEWERTHNYLVITDVQRRAARGLNLDKEWCATPKPMMDCPACGEKVKPGVAVCKSCKAILDPVAARRWGLLPPDNATGLGPDALPPQTPESVAVPGVQEPVAGQGKKSRQVKHEEK